MNLTRRDLLAILILLILVILFFSEFLFRGAFFVYRDFCRIFYPIHYFSAQSIKDGHFPLWNPYLSCGLPFLANPQNSLLYPPFVFTYIFPFNLGLKLFIVLHFFLAGLFMYLLLRDWKIGKVASLVGGVVFAFNGYMLSVIEFLNNLSSVVWIPLVFLFFNRALREGSREKGVGRRFWYIILTGVALGIQFLGGEPTVLYGILIALFLFAIAKGIVRVRSLEFACPPNKFFGRRGVRSSKDPLTDHRSPITILSSLLSALYPLLSILYSLLSACVIALALTLFQSFPFLEMVSLSTRMGGLGYTEAIRWSLAPYELLGLIIPSFPGGGTEFTHFRFGQELLMYLYMGILPFMLIWLAVLYRRDRKTMFWITIFLSSIILSFGGNLPVYRFLYDHLPLFNLMRYPAKFIFLATFSGAILVGMGFDHLLKTVDREGRGYSRFLLSFSLFLFLAWIIAYLGRDVVFQTIRKIYFPQISGLELLELGDEYLKLLNYSALLALFLLMGTGLILLAKRSRITPRVLSWSLLMIIVFDLFIFGHRLQPIVREEFYWYESETLKTIKGGGGYSRIFLSPKTYRYLDSRKGITLLSFMEDVQGYLLPNIGLLHRLFHVEGYMPLRLHDYMVLLNIIKYSRFPLIHHLVNLLNIEYIISREEIPFSGLKLVYCKEKVYVYQNPSFLPRAFFVSEAVVIQERDEILKRLSDPGFDPAKEVILEEEVRGQRSGVRGQNLKSKTQNLTPKTQGSPLTTHHSPLTRIIEYQPNKVIIKTHSQEPGFLFLSDTYYPGWTAYVDGVKTKIYRANYTFRAIELPAGRHSVEFVYRPLSFRVGCLGSLISLFFILVIGARRLMFLKQSSFS